MVAESAPQDVACSVITALGDKFDFIAVLGLPRRRSGRRHAEHRPARGQCPGIGSNTGDVRRY